MSTMDLCPVLLERDCLEVSHAAIETFGIKHGPERQTIIEIDLPSYYQDRIWRTYVNQDFIYLRHRVYAGYLLVREFSRDPITLSSTGPALPVDLVKLKCIPVTTAQYLKWKRGVGREGTIQAHV